MIDDETTDDIPDPLTDRRVRHLLYCLQLYTTPMSLPDIAEQLTVWEQGGRGEEFLQQRLRTYDSLHHDHLPRLRRADVVTYEPSTELVGLGPSAERYTSVVESEFQSEIAGLLEAEVTTFKSNGTG
jgi:hypothetical protein